jgi:hypothetical protein
MQFRWPFPIKTQSDVADEAALRSASAELSCAETELDQARTVYLRLQTSHQTAKLRLQQSVLDQALLRYHAARQAIRQLEQADLGTMPLLGSQRRRGSVGSVLPKG